MNLSIENVTFKSKEYLVEFSNKKQEILIKNGEFNKNEFSTFFEKYSNGTMKHKIYRNNFLSE